VSKQDRGAVYYAWVLGTRPGYAGPGTPPEVLIFGERHTTPARTIGEWENCAEAAFGDLSTDPEEQDSVKIVGKAWLPARFSVTGGQGTLYAVAEANRRVLVWDDADAGSREQDPHRGTLREHEGREVLRHG
jgi:hypothetical protein